MGSNDDSGSGAAKDMENKILSSLEEVLPNELRAKLVNTTELMLDAAGVSLGIDNEKLPASLQKPTMTNSWHRWSATDPYAAKVKPLPEIIDMTPDFHIQGYQPIQQQKGRRKPSKHQNSIVISTATPLPALPPYVDQYYGWEQLAAFVDFQVSATLAQGLSVNGALSQIL